jgi:ketosteroid isomerase-like protein
MKRLIATLFVTGFCVGGGLTHAQTKPPDAKTPPASSGSPSEELRQIENAWVAAVKAKDSAKLDGILADSWVGLGWDGKITDKPTNLAELKSPGNSLASFEMGLITVRLFGNTAIVTGSDTEKSTENGKDTSGKYIWTDVFVKQNGQWRAVASHSTKVPK